MVTVVFCPCLVQFFRPFVVIFRRIGDLFFSKVKKIGLTFSAVSPAAIFKIAAEASFRLPLTSRSLSDAFVRGKVPSSDTKGWHGHGSPRACGRVCVQIPPSCPSPQISNPFGSNS
jgi:hypothetical protein